MSSVTQGPSIARILTDGMGATPSHQAKTQDINANIWGIEEGSGNEIVLPVPFQVADSDGKQMEEGMLGVEGGAVHKSCHKVKHAIHSPGSTVPPSMPATQGPWSYTTSVGDLYPDEHPFIHMTKDSDHPNETPFTLTTSGYPLYKGSYLNFMKGLDPTPIGFKHNQGNNFIDYPIQQPHSLNIQQAQYTQVIMGPLIIGLWDDTDKVYSKVLYASPIYHFDGKLTYTMEELDWFKFGVKDQDCMDWMIEWVGDVSLTAEIHQFWVVTAELERMEQVLVENEDQWGQLASAKLGIIRHLEMADMVKRIEE